MHLVMYRNQWLILETWDYQNSDLNNTIKDSLIKSSSTMQKCAIRTLIEEIKPVGTDQYDFVYRDESLITKSFIFGDNLDFDAENNLVI